MQDAAPARRVFLQRLGIAGLALAIPPQVVAQESAERMRTGQPSATARGAAVHRAVHQVMDVPLVLEDRYAIPMVAPVSAAELKSALEGSSGLRASIAVRSRYAEDRLAAAVARGVRQYVLLGAGFDTYLLRNPFGAKGLRVFEVDHPATQAFKRERLAQAKLAVPKGTTFVGVDFETQSLEKRLRESGLRFDRPVFFSMLGVVIYLTHDAVMETMRLVGRCARGSEIVFSYSLPEASLPESQREGRRRSMERMAALGEPWITFYEPEAIAASLRDAGLRVAEDLDAVETNRRYFAQRTDKLRVGSGHLLAART